MFKKSKSASNSAELISKSSAVVLVSLMEEDVKLAETLVMESSSESVIPSVL